MRNNPMRGKPAHSSSKTLMLLVLGIAGIAVLVSVLYIIGRQIESANYEETRGDLSDRIDTRTIVEYGGQSYAYRSNLLTVLFMGIDKVETNQSSEFRNNGQADFLQLFIIDSDTKQITRLAIDRDTMTEITTLGILGNVSGTRRAQIALSHAFGNSGAQSCELTMEAVQRLLSGVQIDFYVALGLDSISALNDAVGGVTVTLQDDFTSQDPAMARGETLLLTGEQAELFVRGRMDIGDGSNTARMRRQEVYMSALLEKMEASISQSTDNAATLYDVMTPYMVTNMNRGRMINEVNKASGYASAGAPLTIPGEHAVAADGFMTFSPDENALIQLVMDTFFEKIDAQ